MKSQRCTWVVSAAFLVGLLGVATAGCGDDDAVPTDSGSADAGSARVDAGTVGDAGARPDASLDGAAPSDSGVDGGAFDGGGRVPENHRADDSACVAAAPAGNCTFGSGAGMCSMDSDCTAGVNGRCNMNIGGAAFCRCTYDTCMHDTDCATGETCACHGAAFHADSNECIPGNCRVDSDCGASGYCSPTIGGCGGLAGYYCHTAGDLCIDDADCSGSGLQACQYVTASSRWECVARMLCP